MFTKVLIANRGEIAARIIRTCRQLNIQTVAVYSEADQHAPFVKMADESYLIGKPRVNESYLNIDKILEAAADSGAEAIHPGYGLLSENAAFAERVEQAGLTFIGPDAGVIAKMGDKIAARAEMKEAGVPVVPGTEEAVGSVETAKAAAQTFGYPVMLKAAAGGGGIGMQAVHSDEELEKAFEGNSKRAKAFFGDGKMFIEKLIEEPRHIEIQVLADHHGHAVHLFERECSIQRRHQKVVEEAPSPFLSEKTRQEMGESALKAVESLNYTNAGTIEFLVDRNENYYFLEMNTRLQVEHPVTEEISGVDIVHQQLKIAAGEKLNIHQEDLHINGHAIEVRVYAEDPNTFYPSPGTLSNMVLPEGPGIRHELAVESGSDVTPFYDPMIAKLVVHGNDRHQAVERLTKALHTYEIEGIKCNLTMLKRIITHEKFHAGETTTSFIQNYYLPTLTNH
ncbi:MULTISPECIES: acetyl-CoA carboxylase biotin carboxylase subunit [Halobacillus]|uniref:acetyl-CoA carboxylase biotin carboxylase subunit n=1 Tax=Halobacillus TaxID=45667 RepID=UPI001369AB3A|nr:MULTISPECIES: acetyl-CoA carboxylase biotin carboxylase subunit [Halobacillus]MYL28455.1 acetyl-CoA carboxylase biotin carboxylase subunit [Halobacillus halophilus]MYL38113.1 acetyl-CoA carboxylase biotin carboxylase subunit [Halobacillus litoralis]